MSNILPYCQDGCDIKQPLWDFSDCNPDVNRGQIDRLYLMALGGTPLTDWSDVSEWVARMALDPATDLDAITFLNVIGEKPEAEGDVKEISRTRKIVIDKTHTLNFDVDETNLINYEALRQIECGGNFRLWYQNGKYLAGDNDGIEAYITLNDMIPRERKELELFKGKAVWESKFHPTKEINPLS